MKINIFLEMSEMAKNPEISSENNELSKEVQENIINSFQELFHNPDFAAKIQAAIGKMEDPTKQLLANAHVYRILRMHDKADHIRSTIHTRLSQLMKEVTQA